MTEWVAISRESGPRDDVTIANLQDACLKSVVLARARARALQVDQQVERAQQPLSVQSLSPNRRAQRRTNKCVVSSRNQMDARMEIIASMHTLVLMGSVYDVALSHIIFSFNQRETNSEEDPCEA